MGLKTGRQTIMICHRGGDCEAGFAGRRLGICFATVPGTRTTGDYGGGVHVTNNDARAACAAARTILMAVCEINPALTFER